MFTWGVIVFVGLWLILADFGAVRKARLMGNPILMHVIVIGSGLWIHGGSADGAMAAIVSGVCSALYVRYQQRMYGYIRTKSTRCRTRTGMSLCYVQSRNSLSRRRRPASAFPERLCAADSFARATYCAKPWRSTSTVRMATRSDLPESAATASSQT